MSVILMVYERYGLRGGTRLFAKPAKPSDADVTKKKAYPKCKLGILSYLS